MTEGAHRDAGTKTPEGDQPAGGVLAQAPTALIVAVTVGFGLIIAALTAIIIVGKSTTEFTDAMKFFFNALGSIAGLSATLYAASSAKSAKAAREQTNGNLDARIEKISRAGFSAELDARGLTRPPPAPRARPRR